LPEELDESEIPADLQNWYKPRTTFVAVIPKEKP
jgi:hypothetical protein